MGKLHLFLEVFHGLQSHLIMVSMFKIVKISTIHFKIKDSSTDEAVGDYVPK